MNATAIRQPDALSAGPDTVAVHISGVTKSYGDVHAVQGMDLDIERGAMVALLGPNGAGKSTTVSMMLGLQSPDRGAISICGQTPTAAVSSGRIAAMLQSSGLMPGVTVAELLGLAARAYPRPLPVAHAIALANLGALSRRRVDKLSGGQAQRVRFAMAAIANPDVLLLDEPTTAMDVAARSEFWTAMRAYAAAGHTVVFATHYLEEVDDNADRVVVMVAGRVVADGAPASLRALAGASVIRFTAPGGDVRLPPLPGQTDTEIRGAHVTVRTTQPDAAVRTLARSPLEWRDISVAPARLDDSFLMLTANGDQS